MEAFYELSKSPPTHDFVNWLQRVEAAREACGDKELTIRIVPGDRRWSERDLYYTPERRTWRIDNLLIPLAWLVPSVVDVSRGNGIQTLSYANPGAPKKPFFKAPKLAKEIVSRLIPENTVTITLRNSDFDVRRNSRHAEWILVADWLKQKGLFPVFVPDAEADMRGLNPPIPYPSYLAASHNFALRLALYEGAKFNLFQSCGPLMTALYSEMSLMGFGLYIPGRPCNEKAHLRAAGVSPDHDWSTSAHYKKLFWEEDTAENIIPVLADYFK